MRGCIGARWPRRCLLRHRVGVLTTIGEPGGGGGWVVYEVLVRDGSVLMKEMVAEAFIGEGVTPQLTADQAAAIVTTTAAKIG